jgi:hypothetical protein
MSNAEQPTRPDGPNALEVLREAVKLLEQCKQQVARAAEQTQAFQTGNVHLIRLIEETQELVKHGISRAVTPLEERFTRLEARVFKLETERVA